ncbi:RebB family R body protein [Oceanospirillum sediminis]|uniref:RebB family R body protein n=1 Tax=Oceanospirillum sediminis TaxID=2760088 RepID=A0A839ITB5_9GAMM|nr:RebB family R body protein [Oceanospirillum sediminis]MBB1487719.1 RebB family R body protein [Oceanospirillum sediminis]
MDTNLLITDAITQTSTGTLAVTPAMTMANLFISSSHALAQAAHNSTQAQQQGYALMQAVTTQGVNSIQATGNAVIAQLLKRRKKVSL